MALMRFLSFLVLFLLPRDGFYTKIPCYAALLISIICLGCKEEKRKRKMCSAEERDRIDEERKRERSLYVRKTATCW